MVLILTMIIKKAYEAQKGKTLCISPNVKKEIQYQIKRLRTF